MGWMTAHFFFPDSVSVQSLHQIVEQALAGLGYELVDVEFVARGLLRVFMDHPGQALGPTIDDCEAASRQLARVLEVEGVDYSRLEVSSPGLDRVLTKPADFVRFAGERVALRMRLPIEGRRQFEGTLIAGAEGRWVLEWSDAPPLPTKGGVRAGARSPAKQAAQLAQAPVHRIEFSLGDIERARLVPRIAFSGVTGR